MKKLFLMLMISIVFICCNSEEERVELNQGLNFKEINKVKNNGFNFENNNYNFKKPAKDTDLHQGCTAPCCSEGK